MLSPNGRGNIFLSAACLLILGSVVIASISPVSSPIRPHAPHDLNLEQVRASLASFETDLSKSQSAVDELYRELEDRQNSFAELQESLETSRAELVSKQTRSLELVPQIEALALELASLRTAYEHDLPLAITRIYAEAETEAKRQIAEFDAKQEDRVKQREKMGMVPQRQAEAMKRLSVSKQTEKNASVIALSLIENFKRPRLLAINEREVSLASAMNELALSSNDIQRIKVEIVQCQTAIHNHPHTVALLRERLGAAQQRVASLSVSVDKQRQLANHIPDTPKWTEKSYTTSEESKPSFNVSSPEPSYLSGTRYQSPQYPPGLNPNVSAIKSGTDFGAPEYVNGYYRKNGTWVDGYIRTRADYTKENNYSHGQNINPWTNEKSYR